MIITTKEIKENIETILNININLLSESTQVLKSYLRKCLTIIKVLREENKNLNYENNILDYWIYKENIEVLKEVLKIKSLILKQIYS